MPLSPEAAETYHTTLGIAPKAILTQHIQDLFNHGETTILPYINLGLIEDIANHADDDAHLPAHQEDAGDDGPEGIVKSRN